MSLSSGTRLGPYEILGVIGAGGMGEVYRARDTRLGREVAVKVLPSELSHDADRLRRFEQEARLAGSLNHPNVLTVYDVGSHGDAPYLVTELLEGRSLREALASGPLPTRKTIEYAQQIAHGLAEAHAREIVHRDLKPGNVFITKDGRVKILDFGLAKLTQLDLGAVEDSAVSTKTAEGRIVGTVGYMAPEQVRGKDVDARSDIFALGAALYEMLTGERAFRGETTADTLTAILTKDPEEMSRLGCVVPVSLDRLVRRCLEKDPEERFQSARDVAFALDLESGSSHSGEAEAPAVPRRPWRRWAITATVALFAAAVGAWVSHRFWPERSAPPRLLQLTFGRGITEPARFTADGQTIVFTAYWDGKPPEIRSRRLDQTESASLDLPPARLLSVSSRGELAILLTPPEESGITQVGTLARVPLSGGAVRPLLDDARWAVFSAGPTDPGSQLILTPTGAGETLRFDTPQLKTGSQVRGFPRLVWHVDGERVGFNGTEPGRPARAFLFERSTGQVRAVTPENTLAIPGLLPGERVLAYAEDGSLAIHPLSGGEARSVRARLPSDWLRGLPGHQIVRTSGDGRFLFLKQGAVSARIERLELATGQRTPWKVLRPTDATGVWGTYSYFLTPDGEGYAYTYGRVLNDLYLLEGLRF